MYTKKNIRLILFGDLSLWNLVKKRNVYQDGKPFNFYLVESFFYYWNMLVEYQSSKKITFVEQKLH